MRYPRVDMEGLTAIVALAETSDMAKAGADSNGLPYVWTKPQDHLGQADRSSTARVGIATHARQRAGWGDRPRSRLGRSRKGQHGIERD